jgi:cytoskeletal protein CcmA (bactofilin family)
MKNKFLYSLILVFMLGGVSPLFGQGFILQKDIVVEHDEVQDNVVGLGGEIFIKGTVKENAMAFGGMIIIEGEVQGSVVGFGAEILLKPTAKIGGDVVSLGGTIKKELGSEIGGDTVQFDLESSADIQEFFKEGLGGVFGMKIIPMLLIIKLFTLFIWFILAVLLAAVFPRPVAFASSQIRTQFWPVFGTGVLSIIIFTGLVVFSAFLSLILIGIPILIALVFLGIVIKIFGRVVLFHFFGESLSKAFGSKNPSVIGAVILGFILASFIGFIPIFGSLFYFVLSILGWGAAIRTKFGTKNNIVKVSEEAGA